MFSRLFTNIPLFLISCTTILLSSPPAYANTLPIVAKSQLPFTLLMGQGKQGLDRIKRFDEKTVRELAYASRTYEISVQYLKEEPLKAIPRIIHVIWVGPNPFPRKSIRNMELLRKYHPHWKMIFWTDHMERSAPIPSMEKRSVLEYDFKDALPLIKKASNYGEMSDVMRYVILYDMGGMYADHDVTPVRSFEPLAKHYDFVASYERMQYHKGLDTFLVPANGLFLTKPQHPILKKALELTHERWDIAEQLFPNILWQKTIYRTFDSFAKAAFSGQNRGMNKDIILPTSFFYANLAIKKSLYKKLIKKGYVYALHGTHSTWRVHGKKPRKKAFDPFVSPHMLNFFQK